MLNVAPGFNMLKWRTCSSTPSNRSIGMMAGTSDSPTNNGARLGRWNRTTRSPRRASKTPSVLAAGPAPRIATVLILPVRGPFISCPPAPCGTLHDAV